MHREAVEPVSDGRARGAARLVIGPEHEMVDQQLRTPLEQVRERGASAVGVELVRLVQLDPRQRPLALRRSAMAQLGELPRARELLRRAARAFGPRQSLPRARCLAALAEVALAARDLRAAEQALDDARRVIVAHGDHQNATHAGLLRLRRLLLLGRIEQATQGIDELPRTGVPRLIAIADLLALEIARARP